MTSQCHKRAFDQSHLSCQPQAGGGSDCQGRVGEEDSNRDDSQNGGYAAVFNEWLNKNHYKGMQANHETKGLHSHTATSHKLLCAGLTQHDLGTMGKWLVMYRESNRVKLWKRVELAIDRGNKQDQYRIIMFYPFQ